MQLQQNLPKFDDAGVAVFGISYDPVEYQAQFAAEFGIEFPLLADPDSRVIRSVGILNTLIEPHEDVHGIPFPGSYVVGVDGAIEEKRFFQSYRTRPSAASVLRDTLGIDFEVRHHPHVDVEIGAARYPEALPFRVDGLDDDFRVYADEQTRIAIPVANNSRETDAFQIRVRVRYQACSDTECFIPQTRELELEVPRSRLLRPEPPSD